MREIQRLRIEQEATGKAHTDMQANPTLLAELRLLRQRKDELEGRMSSLQDSRRDLMKQLEGLMKLLKVRFQINIMVFKTIVLFLITFGTKLVSSSLRLHCDL